MRGIYEIRNTKTGECYIGKAQSIELRWAKHRERLNAGAHHNYRLQEAWARDGAEAFTWTVLEEIPFPHYLGDAEARVIAEQKPVYNQRAVPEVSEAPFVVPPRGPNHYRRVAFTETVCPTCHCAIDMQNRYYPGLGRVIDVSYPESSNKRHQVFKVNMDGTVEQWEE